MRITCQDFNFQLEKIAREIAFHHFGSFLAGPACSAGWVGLAQVLRSLVAFDRG